MGAFPASSGAGSCEERRGEKRRARGSTPASEQQDHKRGRVLLLPVLMEAARLLQYKNYYRKSALRASALRASLRVTCEAYLKLVGASCFPLDSGALRLIRLLTETHVQAQVRAMAKTRSRPEPRSMELRSMFQLVEIMAREYVAEVKGDDEEILYAPFSDKVFRPVKRYSAAIEVADRVAPRGKLPRVVARSAFSRVAPSSQGVERGSDGAVASVSPVVPSSEGKSWVTSKDVVLETDYEEDDDDDDDEDDEDESGLCRKRADGKNMAQCMCYDCAFGGN